MNSRTVLAALALIALPCVAWSQGSAVQDGQRFNSLTTGGTASTVLVPVLVGGVLRADTTSTALTMNSDGSVSTKEASPSRDDVYSATLISNSALASAAGDSSGVVDVHRYRYLKLLVKAYCTNGASNATARLAFQLREHLNSAVDTMSVFAEYAGGVATNQGVALSLVDSTVTGQTYTGSATQPWSGELTVWIAGNRASPGNAVGAVVWSYPNGISIPLDTAFGRPVRFNKMSLRVRNLGTAAVICSVTLLGFAE